VIDNWPSSLATRQVGRIEREHGGDWPPLAEGEWLAKSNIDTHAIRTECVSELAEKARLAGQAETKRLICQGLATR
jgi:hypothetical protein